MTCRSHLFSLVLFVVFSLRGFAQGNVSLRWVAGSNGFAKVQVTGIAESALKTLRDVEWENERWQRLLAVHREQGSVIEQVGLPPMVGRYTVMTNGVEFVPLFPLDRGSVYRATFWPGEFPGNAAPTKPVIARFTSPPRPQVPAAYVTHIFPSADILPENLLKFYIHFSSPMSRGHIYEHIHLLAENSKPVELPFLELDEELWNPQMTRVTLIIDPGRIKRGVTPLHEVGPALEEGQRFTLVIDREWKDSTGQPLKAPYQKKFRVGPADRDPPDHAKWKVNSPNSGSTSPLTIVFPESMDHALAHRVIHVATREGVLVVGNTDLQQEERQWHFTPEQPWRTGHYRILVQTTIEDLAGNNIGKRFEVDTFEGVQRRFTNATVTLPLEIRPSL